MRQCGARESLRLSAYRVPASQVVGRGFPSKPDHTKDHHKMIQTAF